MHLEIPLPPFEGEVANYLITLANVLQLLANQVAQIQLKEEQNLGK